MKGKVLHKRENKKIYLNIIKRRIGMVNYAKQTVEYTINYLLMKEQKKDEIYESYNKGKIM